MEMFLHQPMDQQQLQWIPPTQLTISSKPTTKSHINPEPLRIYLTHTHTHAYTQPETDTVHSYTNKIKTLSIWLFTYRVAAKRRTVNHLKSVRGFTHKHGGSGRWRSWSGGGFASGVRCQWTGEMRNGRIAAGSDKGKCAWAQCFVQMG